MAINPFQPYTPNAQMTIAAPSISRDYRPNYQGESFLDTPPGFPGQLQTVSEQIAAGFGNRNVGGGNGGQQYNPIDYMKWQETFYKPVNPSPPPAAPAPQPAASSPAPAAPAAAESWVWNEQYLNSLIGWGGGQR